MNVRKNMAGVTMLVLATLGILAAGFSMPATALAAAEYYIEDDATGGDCGLIGNWNDSYNTCTLNRDISVTGTINGIEILDDGITLDGAGHELSLDTARLSQYGVYMLGRNDVYIKNLTIRDFYRGMSLVLCVDVTLFANRFESNGEGLGMYTCDEMLVSSNSFIQNDNNGSNLVNTTDSTVIQNDFIANLPQQARLDAASIGRNLIAMNYWSDWDSRSGGENCVNTTPFDGFCDTAYQPASVNDATPLVIRSFLHRRDWTWYDNVDGDNWVLLGHRDSGATSTLFNLGVGGAEQSLGSVPGSSPGYVPPGMAIASKYAGLRGGPVTAIYWDTRTDEVPVTSQRVLWPKGGDSLEEVPGLGREMFDHHLYWTWYDMASLGFKNWILISNPNAYQVFYNIRIGNQLVVSGGAIPASSQASRQFPGFIGGPVEVEAYNGNGDPVYVMASQRVLSNGDTAFNEVTGQPARNLTDEYVWTWYDNVGGRNWVLVANPRDAAGFLYYEVWIAGVKRTDGGPIPIGSSDFPTFTSTIGGPVELRCFADAAHTVAADCITSQRSLWGESFEEVPGLDVDALGPSYAWTWYDQKSPGSRNWVLVANPSQTSAVSATVSFDDITSGTPVTATRTIGPGERWTPTFPGLMGGPVMVTGTQPGTGTPMPIISSQRVLWNGFFNEVWGQ